MRTIGRKRLSLIIIAFVLSPPFLAACVRNEDGNASDLVVVARLVRIADNAPLCGRARFGSLAEYADIKALCGDYRAEKLFVVHACIDLARSYYPKDSGGVATFKIGDYHRLVLTKENDLQKDIVIKGDIDLGSSPVYYCRRVDNTE
jgi:hypothetical protein